jgi:hypothetical protein
MKTPLKLTRRSREARLAALIRLGKPVHPPLIPAQAGIQAESGGATE